MLTGGRNILLILTTLYAACTCPGVYYFTDDSPITNYEWRVVRIYPHDPEAFTQGLIFRDGYLYESTGLKGKSSLRKIRLETGEIIQHQQIESDYFAEGLTDWNEQLIQLTLSSEIAFVYNLNSFERTGTFRYSGKGWGLTNNGEELIMSDGSSVLRFLDPESFEETRLLTVTDNGKKVPDLNELEMIGDKIFANVLFSDEIIEIDPENGKVTGRVNLKKLVDKVENVATVNVLNGIAYDSLNNRIFVTGKLWPNIYEIEIRESNHEID